MLIISKGIIQYPDNLLFKYNRLVVSERKIIAIIGRNGSGKTSFLNRIVFCLQNNLKSVINTGNFSYVKQISQIHKSISGGEKEKEELLKAFNNQPNLLILDEPSANLDETQNKWLKLKIKHFRGTILLVSHNIDLLNIVDEIWAIDKNELKRYPGNYDDYVNKRQIENLKQNRAYQQQRKLIQRLTDEIKIRKQKAYRIKKENGKKITNSEKKASGRTSHDSMERKMQAGARALENRITKIKKIDKVTTSKAIKFVEINKNLYCKKTILKIKNKDICIDGNILIHNVSLKLKYGEKLWLRGNNGVGKTTLAKMIIKNNHFVLPDIEVGYFNQELKQIDVNKSIWENVATSSAQNTEVIYAMLGGLNLKKIDMPANQLSGGQKVRLQLAKVLLGNNQLLILDEPTNYLDLPTKLSLQKFLKSYPGALLLISHDTQFAKYITNNKLIIVNKSLVKPEEIQKHLDNTTGERLKLELQLDAMINDPKVSIDDIRYIKDKIINIK